MYNVLNLRGKKMDILKPVLTVSPPESTAVCDLGSSWRCWENGDKQDLKNSRKLYWFLYPASWRWQTAFSTQVRACPKLQQAWCFTNSTVSITTPMIPLHFHHTPQCRISLFLLGSTCLTALSSCGFWHSMTFNTHALLTRLTLNLLWKHK